jgi:hypothetical protein
MLQEGKSQLQREKEQLLVEWAVVKEVVSKACHFVPGLAPEEHEFVKAQVVKLAETIQQHHVNVYANIIVLCISIDKRNIRTRSLRNMHSQETQHLS